LGDKDKEKHADGDRVMEDADGANPNPPGNNNTSHNPPQPSQNLPPQKQTALVNEALDLACEQLLNEISFKVMLESDNGSPRTTYSPPTEEELEAYYNKVNATNKIHSSFVVLQSTEYLTGDAAAHTDGAAGEGLGGSTSPAPPPSPTLAEESLAAPTLIGAVLLQGRRWTSYLLLVQLLLRWW
jgi:hypothetical protein